MRFAAALATAALIIVVIVTTQDRSARRKAQDEIQMKVRTATPVPAPAPVPVPVPPIEPADDEIAEIPAGQTPPAPSAPETDQHTRQAASEADLDAAPSTPEVEDQEQQPEVAAETDTGESAEPLDPGAPWSYRQMHAVCFGINDYAFEGIPDLQYARDGAVELATVLRQRFGYDNWAVTLGARASRSGINHLMDMLANQRFVQEDDAVVVYFAGHVQVVPEQDTMVTYLIPQDARITLGEVSSPEQYQRQALRLDDLLTKADHIAARHVLFIIDAPCAPPPVAELITSPREPAADSTARVRQVLIAGRPGQKTYEHEDWSRSAFTHTLLDILREQDRTVSVSQLTALLRQRLPETLAEKFGSGAALDPQAWTLSGDGDFLFIRTIPNAYYTDPQAREVIDAIVQAHGGEQRIRALNKVKTVTYRNSNGQEIIMTRWEMPTALRIDMRRDDKTISQCYDNNDLWVAVDDELMFATPEMAQSLRHDVEDGVFQQAMLSELLDQYHKLIFHGKEKFNDQEYWLLESIGVTGRGVKKYYDPTSFLEKIKVTKGMMGSEVEIHKSYGEFAGVFYPKESELRSEKDMLLGTLDVIEVTSDFDEAIFFRPIPAESEQDLDEEAGDEDQDTDDDHGIDEDQDLMDSE